MKVVLTLFFGLGFCSLSAQTITFHNDFAAEKFIQAGGDLNNDGEITFDEASQVTELFFDIEAQYEEIQEYFILPANEWVESSIQDLHFTNCDGDFSIHEGDLPTYEGSILNFQGLEFFTSLEHLGIGIAPVMNPSDAIENIVFPNNLKSFHLIGIPAIDDLVFPESLTTCQIDSAPLVSADLSQCQGLQNFYYHGAEVEPVLPIGAQIEHLSTSDVDISPLGFEAIQYLNTDRLPPVDINELNSIRKLILVQDSPLTISNNSVEQLRIDGSDEVFIEQCNSLIDAQIRDSRLSKVADNPNLETLQILELREPSSPTIIENCTALSHFRGYRYLGNIELRELLGLRHLQLVSAFFEKFYVQSAPNIEYLAAYVEPSNGGNTVDIDYTNLSKLKILALGQDKLNSLELSNSTELEELYLFVNRELESFSAPSPVLDRVRISGRYSGTLVPNFHEDFNPSLLSLNRVDLSTIAFEKFDRLRQMQLYEVRGTEKLILNGCANIEAVQIFRFPFLNLISLCNSTEDLNYLRLQGGNFTPQSVDVFLPFEDESYIDCFLAIDQLDATVKSCFEVTRVSVEAQLNNELSYYPNPVEGHLFLSSNRTIHRLEIISLSGKTNLALDFPDKSVYLGDLKRGMYLLHLSFGDHTVTRKILVN